jgi:dihydrolipoamide dehydrogenase
MVDLTCDVAIIGAGTAGLAAERSARRNGAKTILIDESFSGTTCTNVGCMPSKLLIAAGDAAHAVKSALVFGVEANPQIDGRAVLERLRTKRDKFIAGIKDSLDALPDGVKHKGHARFVDRARLAIGADVFVQAKAIVIATGAKPFIPRFLGGLEERVLTNETLFELKDLPRSIGVIGAGPLGLELAQALARLGVTVTVFDESDTLAALDDHQIASVLRGILKKEFAIQLGVKLSARRDGDDIALSWSGESGGKATFEYVLAAAGRPPRLDDLDFAASGLTLDEHGAPKVDPNTMQCENAPIFIAGDADHARPVLHEAQAEGSIAGRNAAAFPDVTPARRMPSLSIMFTDPTMALVGARPGKDADILSGSASFEDQGRAQIFATNQGLAKVFADRRGKLIAATIVTPAGEHLAHLLAWAIQQGLSASDLLELPFYHPSYEEGLKPALRAICEAVDSTMPGDRDDGFLADS